jgi:NitT/TauT family transport system ATP-binding protein
MPKLLVKLNRVSKQFRFAAECRQVLRDISLSIQSGDRISLVGPNGSGKTTLLRLLLGLESPDHGTVETYDLTPGTVAYVPQDYRNGLFPWLTLRQNLLLPFSRASRSPDSQMFAEYDSLSRSFRISLSLDKFPYQLSGGEQQIFSLLRALVMRPSLLVVDELLSAVDVARKRVILDYLLHWLSTSDVTFASASHDFDEAVLLADRVCVLVDGNVRNCLPIDLPWPRRLNDRDNDDFRKYVQSLIDTLAS